MMNFQQLVNTYVTFNTLIAEIALNYIITAFFESDLSTSYIIVCTCTHEKWGEIISVETFILT